MPILGDAVFGRFYSTTFAPPADTMRPMNTRHIEDAALIAAVRYACCSGDAKEIRETARLSTSDVARAVGVNHSSIVRWESATHLPTGVRAVAYGRLLVRLKGSQL